jgi:hypothetical protein
MDRNAPEDYIESTEKSILDTEKFINYLNEKGNALGNFFLRLRLIFSKAGDNSEVYSDVHAGTFVRIRKSFPEI